MEGFLTFIIIIGGIVLLVWLVIKADERDEKRHLEFLSERIGYKVLSKEEWFKKNNIDWKKHWNDDTVRRAYNDYIWSIETKVNDQLS